MSNKITKGKKKNKPASVEIMGQILEYAVALAVITLGIVVPLYAPEGYHKIGDAKFDAYRMVVIPGLSLLIVLGIFYLIFTIREKQKWHLSITDFFVMGYLLCTLLAMVSGGFYDTVFWGSNGWNMGLFAQVSFVLFYFFLSRFGKYYKTILAVFGVVAAVIFSIGILHRMLIDPTGFYEELSYEQKAQFLSLLGQATWYASYLVVILPVAIGIFLYSKKRMVQMISGVFTMLGFMTLVSQNSDSAYFALAGFFLVFLWDGVRRRDTLFCYFLVISMFLTAGKVMNVLLQIHPNPEFYYDFMTELVLTSGITWVLLFISVAVCIILYLRRKKSSYPEKALCIVRNGIYLLTAIGIVVAVVLIILQTKGLLPAYIAEKLNHLSYVKWDDQWGNGRGRIWTFSWKVFTEESVLHKLLGIGPDCFSSYLDSYYQADVELLWGEKILTNAHNEWLTTLINVGIAGFLCYVGIFLTGIRRTMQQSILSACDGMEKGIRIGIVASMVSYMAYNFFCYQQVLCTPFIFLLMGIGEYMTRQITVDKSRART